MQDGILGVYKILNL